MPHFLWVEDFKASETEREPNIISSTIDLVFGGILKNQEFTDEYQARRVLEKQGVFLRLNLLDALDFIHNPNELAKVDFVVLDVDMPLQREGQTDKNNYLPALIKQYQSETELKKIAGYQIYIDLVIELGFPKSHILFCSNHAGYFEEFTAKFESSNIKFPKLLQKEHKEDIKDWLTEAHSDYFVLRRGIIEGCNHLKALSEKLTKDDDLAFNSFIDQEKQIALDDIRNYLDVLANFLPLREPVDKAALYKLFIRTLTHEWEAADPKKIRGLAWIMKSTRNWITHNSNLFNALDEQMVAYLFIINMRLMFNFDDAVQSYEKILLNLFVDADFLKEDVFKNQLTKKLIPFKKPYLKLRSIILDENKCIADDNKNNSNKKRYIRDAIYFNELANNLQESDSDLKADKKLFASLLYQMFWLNTSVPQITIGNKRDVLEIIFKDYGYAEKPYLFELARHIYNHSFSQGEKS